MEVNLLACLYLKEKDMYSLEVIFIGIVCLCKDKERFSMEVKFIDISHLYKVSEPMSMEINFNEIVCFNKIPSGRQLYSDVNSIRLKFSKAIAHNYL